MEESKTTTKWYGVHPDAPKGTFGRLHTMASEMFIVNHRIPMSVVTKYDVGMKDQSKWKLGVSYRECDEEEALFSILDFENAAFADDALAGHWIVLQEDVTTDDADGQPMTLDEAIEHAEQVANEQCGQCSAMHRQLADWLRELKARRSAEDTEPADQSSNPGGTAPACAAEATCALSDPQR